eukprot:scaffold499_cov120-Cylindrotheca_fusiformis.AAC.10
MRMGKVDKPRRGVKAAPRVDAKGKPKHAAAGGVVGQLSPDIISTYLGPQLKERASIALEKYAADLLEYEDIVRDLEKLREEQAEIDSNGRVHAINDQPIPPTAPLYRSAYWVKELDNVLSETSTYFQSKSGGWKIHARAARFERLMDEKYGMFRPFLKDHPELERFVRSTQVKYASGYFSPFRQGKAPIPKSTAVIILFMMKRGEVRWEIITLATLFFLVGLQPWALVVLVASGHLLLEGRKKRAIKPMKAYIPTTEPYYETSDHGQESSDGEAVRKSKVDILLKPVGTKLRDGENVDASKYDTMILGSGPDALYTGALLSRAGRKVMVLTSEADASGCFTIEEGKSSDAFQNVPFDVANSNISKISGQQGLLAPALSTSTDCQGGIRFAKIGSEDDDYSFAIFSVPGMGADGGKGTGIPFVLRGNGISGLAEDTATYLGDGWPDADGRIASSSTALYAATCESINSSAAQFYLSKILAENVNDMRKSGIYQDIASRYASAFLDKGFQANPHARSLLAAIGMKGENIKPSMTSMGPHVTNISAALSGEGMHYPIGGPRALSYALASIIEQSEGCVFTNVPLSQLLFELDNTASPVQHSEENAESPPRCIGVKLCDNREIKFGMKEWSNTNYTPTVISMHGFLTTYMRLTPSDIRTKFKIPVGLPALTESRPVFKALFVLQGCAIDLDVTGADFYRVPAAALAQDEFDPVTNQLRLGEIGWVDESSEEEVDPNDINKDPAENPQGSESLSRDKRNEAGVAKAAKKRRTKFETGKSWIQISFPSAKDPSFESRHGSLTTCVVTVEADDDFVTMSDSKPKIYSIHKNKGEASADGQRLIERIRRDLLDVYPQLEGKILSSRLVGPLLRGLSHNPERYVAKGVRPGSLYPGLYVGGSDLTVGDSFSGSVVGGWLVANAVVGYNAVDHLFLQKNITSDIARFLEEPDIPEEEDIAVPYETRRAESSSK